MHPAIVETVRLIERESDRLAPLRMHEAFKPRRLCLAHARVLIIATLERVAHGACRTSDGAELAPNLARVRRRSVRCARHFAGETKGAAYRDGRGHAVNL